MQNGELYHKTNVKKSTDLNRAEENIKNIKKRERKVDKKGRGLPDEEGYL